jgi:uracil-DNA glycosylase family 4
MGLPLTQIRDCSLCPALTKGRKCIVNGAGVNDAKIAFVGEGPGQVEDEKRRPFMGKAGRVLKVIEWAAGINQYKVYHTNATRCWGGRNPTATEIDACHDYLIQELRELNPTVIVALGAAALRSLYRPNITVGSVMGFTLYNDELPGTPIIPTYHPSYIMRKNWGKVALVLAHFRKAKRIADAGGLVETMGSYMGVTTLEELRGLRDYLLGPAVDIIAVDTETCGLSWMDSELLCVSFSGERGVGYSVPILHRGTRTVMKLKGRGKNREKYPVDEWYPVRYWSEEDEPEAIAIIEEILSSDKPKSGQNIGFDIRMLERSPDEEAVAVNTALGFHVNNVKHCTKMLAGLLSEVNPASLSVLTAYHTDIPYYEGELSHMKSRMWEVEDKKLWVYGGGDVDSVSTLVPELLPRVQEEGTEWVYENISIPLIRCATRLEERGVYIDREHFDKLCRYYTDQLRTRTRELTKAIGHEVESPSYYKNVQELVFKELDLPLTAQATKGALKDCRKCKKERAPCSAPHASTGADDLEELNVRSPHPVLPILIDIRHLEKLKGTYLDGGKKDEGGFKIHIRKDKRIHARWNASRAATGRFSCEEPNMMNPPKNVKVQSDAYDLHTDDAIRQMFVAPPGYGLLSADWSQLEVWMLAYETGDPTLLGILLGGNDVHTFVARKLCELGVSHLFPKASWEPDLDDSKWRAKYEALRDKAKVFTFGLIYLISEQGCADRLGCSLEEVKLIFQAFLTSVFPTLPNYQLKIREEVLTTYGVTNKFGRRRHFPEVPILAALKYRTDLEAVIRVANNFPLQSGGHDLHSLAHIATEAELSSWIQPVQEMHDSLLCYTPLERLDEAAVAIKTLWEGIALNTILPSGERLDWHIPVDVKCGQSFGDLR